MFVCFGLSKKGFPASKQTVRKWIVEAISLAYEVSGQPLPCQSSFYEEYGSPQGLTVGSFLKEVCDATGWSSPLRFVRFYNLYANQALSCLGLSVPQFHMNRHL